MDQQKINTNLAEQTSEGSEFQRKVVEYVRKLMKASADRMSPLHDQWDNNAYIYRGYRPVDREDRDALKDGEPPKIIVPITYAQIQTAISFILSTFSQRDNLWELKGGGPEDEENSFSLNMDLQYQINNQKMMLKLYFWLLDAWKNGFGVMQTEWVEEWMEMRVQKQVPETGIVNSLGAIFGREVPTKTVEALDEVLSYQGNQLKNISPYAFYPDPAVTIANFQEGMFCGHEEEVSRTLLESKDGEVYFGVDEIPKTMSKELFTDRKRRVRGPFDDTGDSPKAMMPSGQDDQQSQKVIVTTVQVMLSEKQASETFGGKLGSSTKPIKWLITIANDQKLIRFEPCGYLHKRYNYEVFEFSPDHDAFFNPGLSDTIGELQNLVTFFLNSHIVNIRKIIANRFILDPTKVMTEDVKNGSIYIRTQGAVSDISRVIKQLETSDVTGRNVADMETLAALVQTITGVSDNALGQYSSGRRSGTEARAVNAGSGARLKMHAQLAWLQGVEPLGRQVVSNTRQWRTKEVYDLIVGQRALDTPYEQVILADPMKLAGGYDFIPYDATLPTDRQQQAGMLTELFTTLVQNPATIQLLNKNPIKLLNRIAMLYGIRDLKDFDLTPLPPGASQDGIVGAPALPEQPQPEVVPDQVAADAAGAGATPVDMQGNDVLASLIGG